MPAIAKHTSGGCKGCDGSFVGLMGASVGLSEAKEDKMQNQIGDTRNRWFVVWEQHKLGDYFSDCLNEDFDSREDAIQYAKDAFADWGTIGHPDYKGLWWSVCEVTEEWDGFDWQDKETETVYETDKCA